MFRINPFYYLVRLILRSFESSNLESYELEFVQENARKHAKVLAINAVAIALVIFGLQKSTSDAIGQIITALLAPVMVIGVAWFEISFGGVPKKLMNIAMDITTWMFMAFVISLSTMFIAVLYTVDHIMWPVFITIYIGAIISCILYDTADGLKAGLDEAVLKHSRAAILFYKKQGIEPEEK